MIFPCSPLLLAKAGVTLDVTLRLATHNQERLQAREPLWLYNPQIGHTKSKREVIIGPTNGGATDYLVQEIKLTEQIGFGSRPLGLGLSLFITSKKHNIMIKKLTKKFYLSILTPTVEKQ